jgi:chromosome segregation ATPase
LWIFFPGQEEFLAEVQQTHRLASASQSDRSERLQQQLRESEALISSLQNSATQAAEQTEKFKADFEQLQSDLERTRGLAKEEEEKRVKAISLLKTVRAKLVKAEKEKEEALKEAALLKEKDASEREKEKAERARLQGEVDEVQKEREQAVVGLRNQFDREIANLKDRFEREALALRGQYEIEAISLRVRLSVLILRSSLTPLIEFTRERTRRKHLTYICSG